MSLRLAAEKAMTTMEAQIPNIIEPLVRARFHEDVEGLRRALRTSSNDRITALEAFAKACEPLIACVHEIAANGSKIDKKLAVDALKAHLAAWDGNSTEAQEGAE